MMNETRREAAKIVRFRNFKRRNILRPQDYRLDEIVLVYETSPLEAIRRLERFKTEREAGLR